MWVQWKWAWAHIVISSICYGIYFILIGILSRERLGIYRVCIGVMAGIEEETLASGKSSLGFCIPSFSKEKLEICIYGPYFVYLLCKEHFRSYVCFRVASCIWSNWCEKWTKQRYSRNSMAAMNRIGICTSFNYWFIADSIWHDLITWAMVWFPIRFLHGRITWETVAGNTKKPCGRYYFDFKKYFSQSVNSKNSRIICIQHPIHSSLQGRADGSGQSKFLMIYPIITYELFHLRETITDLTRNSGLLLWIHIGIYLYRLRF